MFWFYVVKYFLNVIFSSAVFLYKKTLYSDKNTYLNKCRLYGWNGVNHYVRWPASNVTCLGYEKIGFIYCRHDFTLSLSKSLPEVYLIQLWINPSTLKNRHNRFFYIFAIFHNCAKWLRGSVFWKIYQYIYFFCSEYMCTLCCFLMVWGNVAKMWFSFIFAEFYVILDKIVWLTAYDNPIHCFSLSNYIFCAF